MTEAILALLGGLLIGSFLNVCIHRLPDGMSVVRPRSSCPKCNHMIAWYDNIPVLSYLLLGGRCRSCRTRIPLRYPLVELLTGLAFMLCVGVLGLTLAAAKWCLFSAFLIALMATDFERHLLPDELTIGGTAAGLLLAVFVDVNTNQRPSAPLLSFGQAAFGAGIASGAIWLIGWAYQKLRHRDGLGLGDVKMLAMMGAFLGAPNTLLAITAGSLFGAIVSVAYIRITRKDPATYELPFGTFLGLGALCVALFCQVVCLACDRITI